MTQYRPRHVHGADDGADVPGSHGGEAGLPTPPAGTPAVPSGRRRAERARRSRTLRLPHLSTGASLALVGTGVLAIMAGLVVLSLPATTSYPRLASGNGHAGPTSTGAGRRAASTSATVSHGGHHVGRPAGTSPAHRPYTAAGHSPGSTALSGTEMTAPATNLPAPAGFGPVLRQAWIAAQHARTGITAADVQSTAPGTVFYAVQRSTGYAWAISRFLPTVAATTAGNALASTFSDYGAFRRAPGAGWSYVGSFAPGTCPTAVPAPVLTAWGMCGTVGS